MLPTGARWWRQPPKGECISSPAGRLYGFIQTGAEGAHLASAAILYTSRGRKPSTRPGGVSRSRTEPLAPRAKGPAAPSTFTPVRACQPSGILESTTRSRSRPHHRRLNPQAPKGLAHKKNPPHSGWIFFISLPFSGLLYLSPLSFLSFLQPVLHILPLSLPVLSPYTRRSRGPGRRGGPGEWPRRGRR